MSDYFSMAACLPKTEHYCYAESVVGKTWRSCAWEQCEHCKKYQEMKVPAHFPVPAIPLALSYAETANMCELLLLRKYKWNGHDLVAAKIVIAWSGPKDFPEFIMREGCWV